MSMETSKWLNTRTLIGMTDKRGNAWHYRADDQGSEPNHYPLAIPVEDVRRRLFNWEAVEGDLTTSYSILSPEGVETVTLTDPVRKTIIRPPGAFGPSDPGGILGVFKDGYTIHQFDEWLLQQVAHLIDDDLSISSAGLLKEGGIAWVELSVPDTIITPEGVEFRPNLLAATSLNGDLSSTYARTIQNTVCDNTMSAALSEKGQKIKVKHSRYSKLKLQEARDALAIVHETGDDFAAQVADLCNTTVTDEQWTKFIDALAPVEGKEGRSLTMAQNKRDTLTRLWTHDQRVTPWKNTAWGVVQAMNTATHHEFTVHGDRAERNMLRAVTGGVDKLDAATLITLKERAGVVVPA